MKLILAALFSLYAFSSWAQPRLVSQNLLGNESPSFLENKGQVTDQNGKLRPDVKFIYDAKSYKLILRETGFSHEFYWYEKKPRHPEPVQGQVSEATGLPLAVIPANAGIPSKFQQPDDYTVHVSRVDIDLQGCNPHPQILTEGQSSWYNNYYLAHTPEEGIRQVHSYQKVTYKNIYNHIDFVFLAQPDGKLKYNIIIHPGGKLSDVQLVYAGSKPVMPKVVVIPTQAGISSVTFKTNLGELKESIPSSYIEGTNEAVKVEYTLRGPSFPRRRESHPQSSYIVYFKSSSKPKEGKTLVIDPEFEWGTYYGGNDDEFGHSTTADAEDHVYLAGETASSTSIATSGSYQNIFGGGSWDVFLVKFDKTGSREWATYYGGDDMDFCTSLTCDLFNNIFFAGITSSSFGIASSGANQTKLNGRDDAFLVKFDEKGFRKWATYFGGNDHDFGYSITSDSLGNTLFCGTTTSTSGIASFGAAQSFFGGGFDDAFVVKFDSSGSKQWSTYFGGKGEDDGNAIAVDKAGNVLLAGTTESSDNISSLNAYQTSIAGKPDAFLVKYSKNGSLIWGTYFGGEFDDQGYSVCADASGNIFLAGYTISMTSISTSSAYQTSSGGNYDAFLAKFAGNGERVWSTYFGGQHEEYCRSVAIDNQGNIYIAGYTNSSNGISSASGYILNYRGGYWDAFLAEFSNEGNRLWSTYYGGSGADFAWSITLNNSGAIYLAGYTASTTDIASTGAFQRIYGGGLNDAFLAKFVKSLPPDPGIPRLSDSIPEDCSGINYVGAWLKNFSKTDTLDSVIIAWSINGAVQKNMYWKGLLIPGDSARIPVDTIASKNKSVIKIWTYMPNGGSDADHTNDTSQLTLQSFNKIHADFDFKISCAGNIVRFSNKSTVSNTGTFFWNFGDGNTSTDLDPAHQYKSQGSYLVSLKAFLSGCSDSISKTVILSNMTGNPELYGVSVEADTFNHLFWKPFPDAVRYIVYRSLDDKIYLLLGQVTDTQWVDSDVKVHSQSWYYRVEAWDSCGNHSTWSEPARTILLKGIVAQDETYAELQWNSYEKWPMGVKEYVLERSSDPVKSDWLSLSSQLQTNFRDEDYFDWQSFQRCYRITAKEQDGNSWQSLSNTLCIPIKPRLFVPDAFTPNGNGLNDTFFIRGAGIESIHWEIFNRWGEKLFESNSLAEGWNPKDAPAGAYLYRVEAKTGRDKFHKYGLLHLLK